MATGYIKIKDHAPTPWTDVPVYKADVTKAQAVELMKAHIAQLQPDMYGFVIDNTMMVSSTDDSEWLYSWQWFPNQANRNA